MSTACDGSRKPPAGDLNSANRLADVRTPQPRGRDAYTGGPFRRYPSNGTDPFMRPERQHDDIAPKLDSRPRNPIDPIASIKTGQQHIDNLHFEGGVYGRRPGF